MGLFDFFRRRRQPPLSFPDGDGLRDAFVAAHAAGDEPLVRRILRDCADDLRRHAPSWTRVPEPIRQDRHAVDRYMQAVIWLAVTLEQQGHPQLLAALNPPGEQNPVTRWQNAIGRAQALAKEQKLDEAIGLLNDALIDHRDLRGTAADHFAALSHGLLGHLHASRAAAAQAIGHYQAALRLCEQSNDADGVRVYTNNLYEMHRYLGDGATAATFADRHADAKQSAGDAHAARRFRRLAHLARGGEPPLRMCAVIDGRTYELDEVPPIPRNVRVRFDFVRNRPTVPLAHQLAERGATLANEGRFDDALDLFRDAARIDPHDPDPHYKAAHALIRLGRYPQAIEELEATEQLAPGWYQVRHDLGLARRVAAGAFPHEAAVALWLLPDLPDRAEMLNLADQVAQRHPTLPEPYFLRGLALADLDRTADALAAFRIALTHDPDPDLHSRILFNLAARTDDPAERARAYAGAVSLFPSGGNLMAFAGATVLSSQFARG